KASSVSSVGGWAGAPGVALAAKGLKTLFTKLETIPIRMSTGSVTIAVVLVTAAGCCETLTSPALCMVAAVVSGAAAADAMGVVAADVCAACVRTWVASTLLVGAAVSAAGAFTAAEMMVVFAGVESDPADAAVGCAGAIAAVIAEPPLDAVPPRISGAGT